MEHTSQLEKSASNPSFEYLECFWTGWYLSTLPSLRPSIRKKSRSFGLFRTGVGGSTPFHRFWGCFSNNKGDLDTTNLITNLPISPQNNKFNDKTPPYVSVDAGGLQKVRLTFPTMKVKISDSFWMNLFPSVSFCADLSKSTKSIRINWNQPKVLELTEACCGLELGWARCDI